MSLFFFSSSYNKTQIGCQLNKKNETFSALVIWNTPVFLYLFEQMSGSLVIKFRNFLAETSYLISWGFCKMDFESLHAFKFTLTFSSAFSFF